ncbi:ABC transporter substrate-binding protein [Rhodococcus opacus]|uniref:ABC transporter substrate-binding protein n=1 Tax=Rhodococcus opacus TaxID=37919 RepID=UPI001300747D|nr:ABC transporter substrate-binding protein [Rhodococcus opacus]
MRLTFLQNNAFRVGILGICAVAAVTSCAGTAGQGSSGPAGAPVETATVRFAVTNPPTQLDPIATTNEVNDLPYFTALYDGLTGVDSKGELVNLLAESYDESDDRLTWTFTLRNGATFHDGSPIDGEAVVANLNRALVAAPQSGVLRPKLESVESITSTSPTEISVKLKEPDPGLPVALASPALGMVSPASFGAAATAPIGSGPYKFESRAANKVVYAKYDEYWNPDTAKAARIEISGIPDGTARINGLRSGQIDATIAQLNLSAEIDALQSNPGFQVLENPTTSVATLYLNTSHTPLDNPLVRKALNYAVDRKAISDSLLGGKCTPTDQPFPNGPGYVEELNDEYNYDPAKARELLAEAGVQNLQIDGIFLAAGLSQTLAPAIQAQFAEAGIDLQLTSQTPAEVRPAFRAGGPDLMIHQINAEADTSSALANNFVGPDNPGGASQQIKDLADAAIQTPVDSPEREQALEAFTRAAVAEPVHVHICSIPNFYVGASAVTGLDQMPWSSTTLTPDVRSLGKAS